MTEEYDDGFTIQFENGSRIGVATEDSSWREDPSRLTGMNTSFMWVPGPHYSELGEEGAVWGLQQGVRNAVSLTVQLLSIPQKYELPPLDEL